MADPKKTNTKPLTKSGIETPGVEIDVPEGYKRIPGYARVEAEAPIDPVNHVQTDEFYELPRVSNEVAKPVKIEPVVPVVALESANVEEHKTGLPSNTTGGQLDLAIDRFHAQQEKDIPAAKLDLLARLRILELEAEAFVKEKIDAIRAVL